MAGYSNRERITAACFYGASSFLIMFVNKWVLTVYNFPAPQFLAMAQFVGGYALRAQHRLRERSTGHRRAATKSMTSYCPAAEWS